MSMIPAPTRGLTTREPDMPPATPTIAQLCDLSEEHVNRATALFGDISDLHGSAVSHHTSATSVRLGAQAQELARRNVVDLLNELAETGLGWRLR